MNELEKVVRGPEKGRCGCPHAVLLVLDATVGQNAFAGRCLPQDGRRDRAGHDQNLPAPRGAAFWLALSAMLWFAGPLHWVVGEGIDDLAPFNGKGFREGGSQGLRTHRPILGDAASVAPQAGERDAK